MEEALHKLTQAIQILEEAVVANAGKNAQNKAQIEQLQQVIRTTYDRINQAIEEAKKQPVEPQEKQEDVCLSLS